MKKGFTLIELMIVVVIIGILAAIAIPKFSDVSESAKRNACRANMRTIASQEVIYYALNSGYAATLVLLDMDGVMCPASEDYVIAGTSGAAASFSVSCITAGHGAINNGIATWIDSN